jgi:hypothetical protein
MQPAVGRGDRGLGRAQRVARLAALGFAAFELVAQRVDLRAQRGEVFFARRCPGRKGSEQNGDEKNPVQAFVFPWAATAATRRATSSGSPR